MSEQNVIQIDWAAVLSAVNNPSHNTIDKELFAVRDQVKVLLNKRYEVREHAKRETHIALLRSLEPNTPLTYCGRTFMFFNKEMLLEKCNKRYVIVQAKDVDGKKGWSRWNIEYRDLQALPLSEQQRDNRRVGLMMMKVLSDVNGVVR